MGKGRLIRWGFLILALTLSCQIGSHPVLPAATRGAANPGPLPGVSFRLNAALPTAKGASRGVYYVAPDGDDSNPGTEDEPWETIQKAANTLVAGDTVYIKAGTYNERVSPQNSGSSGSYITYAAYPDHTVIIDGNRISISWGGVFDIQNRGYIKVSGLRVINSDSVGIFVRGSSHIIIEKSYTYNTVSSGIGVWESAHIIIDGNEVELACNDGENECITVAITDAFEVKNNHIHHGGPGSRGGEGIDVKQGSSNGKVYNNHVHHLNKMGIYVDAFDMHTSNIEVSGNIVHDTQTWGIAATSEQGGLLENVTIVNNVVYNNASVGILVHSNPLRNISILNNTVYYNGYGQWYAGGIFVRTGTDVIVRNNISSQNNAYQLAIENLEDVTADHNLIDGYRGGRWEVYGDDPVIGDPKFVNAAGGDFHLKSGSPAIDAALDVGITVDFGGNSRPQGAGYDIGAHEYTGSVPPTATPQPTSTPPPSPTLTPTRTPTPTPTPLPGELSNVALGESVTTSNEEYLPASDLVDGVWDMQWRYWAGRGAPNWVKVDLGQDYRIERIRVGPFGNGGADNYYYDEAWNIRYAPASNPDTLSDFTSVDKLSGAGTLAGGGINVTNGDPGSPASDDDHKYYEFTFDPVEARYILYTVVEGDRDGDSNGAEIEVYAIPAANPPWSIYLPAVGRSAASLAAAPGQPSPPMLWSRLWRLLGIR